MLREQDPGQVRDCVGGAGAAALATVLNVGLGRQDDMNESKVLVQRAQRRLTTSS